MKFISVPCIVIICYLFAEILKIITAKCECIKRLLPFLVGVLGGILGGVAFKLYPGFISVSTMLEAIAVGIISGLASTGSNQILKQILKGEKKNEGEFF